MIHYEQESTKQRCSPNKESINKVCKIKFELECPWPEQKKIACGPLCRFTEMSSFDSFFVKRYNRPLVNIFQKKLLSIIVIEPWGIECVSKCLPWKELPWLHVQTIQLMLLTKMNKCIPKRNGFEFLKI